MVEENKLSGKWYQVARYLVHGDFLEAGSVNEWQISYKKENLLDLEIKVDNVIYGGYILTNRLTSSLSVVVSIKNVLYEIDSYYLLYIQDRYMILGNTKDMFIFSTTPILERSIVEKISKECGYEPQWLVVNHNYNINTVIRAPEPFSTSKKIVGKRIDDNTSPIKMVVKSKK